MRLLLDTYALIYALGQPHLLKESARTALEDPAHTIYFSPASVWEIEIKASLGKLERPAENLGEAAAAAGFEELAIRSEHAARAGRLEMHHRDPFDRMLIAQALVHELTVVTPDPLFAPYGIPTLDC